MPARRTQLSRRLAARDAIAEAAVRVIAARGYDAASMDDIRLAAGCSKGALYHHFGSKQAVLEEVVKRTGAAFGAMEDHPANGALGLCLALPVRSEALIVEIWAAASRDEAMAETVRNAFSATADAELGHLGAVVQAAIAAASGVVATPVEPRAA